MTDSDKPLDPRFPSEQAFDKAVEVIRKALPKAKEERTVVHTFKTDSDVLEVKMVSVIPKL